MIAHITAWQEFFLRRLCPPAGGTGRSNARNS